MIARADTFYVASYVDREDGTRQVDVSHRGGKPGFVRVGSDGMLTIPDFSGNLFFMTLGNIHVNPKTGLLFIDSETGDMLQMTGDAQVVLDSPEIAAFEGAERLWTFTARQVVLRPGGLPLRWRMEADGWSPNLLMTGSWSEASDRLAAAALAQRWRPFRVARVVEESSAVRSLYLAPADGVALIPPLAGQHLPVRMTLDDAQVLSRSYTLSMAPSDGQYRISVKKEGRASHHLHTLREGDLLEVRAPAGGFTVDAAERRPAVLLAAGIGITPLLAMLRHLVHEGRRTRTLRPTWLFHAARTREERPFDDEIAALLEDGKGGVRRVRTLSQPAGAVPGRDYEKEGRIDMALLKATLPFDDYDFYLCGPAAFMQATTTACARSTWPTRASTRRPSGRRRCGVLPRPSKWPRLRRWRPSRCASCSRNPARKGAGTRATARCSTWPKRAGCRRRSAAGAAAAAPARRRCSRAR
jgi:ferredoxin-NADP reductase